MNRSGTEKKAQTSAENEPVSPIRRLFRHSAIYSISTSVQRLQGLILTPVYTSTLYLPQVSQYGNYGLVYTFIAFMNFVYLYGMDAAFLRYFFLGKKSPKSVFSSSFLILILSSLVTSVLLLVFAGSIAEVILFSPALAPLVRLAALILFFDTIGNFPFLILRAEERPVTFTVFRMLRFSLELIFNIIFVVVLKKGVPGILYANLLASMINLIVMSPFAAKYFQLVIDFPLVKQMVRFGLPFLPNGIAFMTIEMMDRFLVTKYLGKDVMAFYHANCKFATVLLLLIVGFRNAWQPFFLKIARDKNAQVIYSRILNYFVFGAGSIVIFMLFFIKPILTHHYFSSFYILGTKYWAGIPIIPWRVFAYFLFGIYVIFTPAFYITKKSQYMFLFTGAGAVINILLNFLLLPRIGMWGAVTATVGAYFVMALLISMVAQKIYPIPLNYKKLFWGTTIIALSFLIHHLFRETIGWLILFFIVMVIIFLFTMFNMQEISRLKFSASNPLKKKR